MDAVKALPSSSASVRSGATTGTVAQRNFVAPTRKQGVSYQPRSIREDALGRRAADSTNSEQTGCALQASSVVDSSSRSAPSSSFWWWLGPKDWTEASVTDDPASNAMVTNGDLLQNRLCSKRLGGQLIMRN